MEQNLNEIRELFNSIVELIGSLFGFLPSWCLVFVGSSFVFVVAVFIYKLIRG